MHTKASLTDLFDDEEKLPVVWVSQGDGPYSDDAPYKGQVIADPLQGMLTSAGEPIVSWLQGIGSATLMHNYARVVSERISDARVYRIGSPHAAWVLIEDRLAIKFYIPHSAALLIVLLFQTKPANSANRWQDLNLSANLFVCAT